MLTDQDIRNAFDDVVGGKRVPLGDGEVIEPSDRQLAVLLRHASNWIGPRDKVAASLFKAAAERIELLAAPSLGAE